MWSKVLLPKHQRTSPHIIWSCPPRKNATPRLHGGAGNLLVDVDEDQGAELPVLNSIWECPKVNTFIGYDNLM